MAEVDREDLKAYCLEMAQRAKRAAAELARVTGAQKNQWLRRSGQLLLRAVARPGRGQPAGHQAAPELRPDATPRSTGCG